MRIFILIFAIALAVTVVSTPWFRRLAIGTGFVDAPGQRKVHGTPMPLLGGLAIFAGAIIATLLVFGRELPPQIMGALLAGILVASIGLVDDRRHVPPWVRLLAQFAAFIILALFGVRVRLPLPEAVNYALTFLWLVGITNSINLMDNMDGLSAGVVGVAAAFITLIGALNNQYLVSGLAAAILGACLGFLRYNFKPAQIFMGDAGAYFLGFWLAVLGIQLRFPANVNFVTWMVPVMVLGLPIFDTTLVVVSRLRRGVHPFTGGRDHVSHRLVKLGMTQREAVLTLYLIGGAFGMVAIFITQATVLEGYFIGAVVAAICLYAMWRLEQIIS
ncbi:MAG: MraY family glycosyltransferase [Candidatus Promineifilaceae bacterium]|nr:MraY family glycosyltransferase [Candidatus Promineifilaceae bacterium]